MIDPDTGLPAVGLTGEERRALEWQADQMRRAARVRVIQLRLQAPPGPANALIQNQEPLLLALENARETDDVYKYFDEQQFNA